MERVDLRRRSTLEIVASILDACHRQVKKSELSYLCNMSGAQLSDYLNMLLEANLLRWVSDGSNLQFIVSKKGKEFLKAYESLKPLIE